MKWSEKVPPRLAALMFVAIYMLVAPLAVGLLTESAAMASLVAVCGAFVCLLIRLDDLIELSLGPMKAKMKETLREAAATIGQLQSTAAIHAKAQLMQLMSSSFFSGQNMAQRMRLHDEIIGGLRQIGVSEAEISLADEPWRKGVGVIYMRSITNYLTEAKRHEHKIDWKAAKEAAVEIQAMLDFPNWLAPSPDRMAKAIEAHGVMTDELQSWLSDHRHFLATGEIRRLDQFVQQ